MNARTYNKLQHAYKMGERVQFQLPNPCDKKWIDWHHAMEEPSLGYALCKWRICPTTADEGR